MDIKIGKYRNGWYKIRIDGEDSGWSIGRNHYLGWVIYKPNGHRAGWKNLIKDAKEMAIRLIKEE